MFAYELYIRNKKTTYNNYKTSIEWRPGKLNLMQQFYQYINNFWTKNQKKHING